MIRYGTAYFVTRECAYRYYAVYGFAPKDVDRKLREHEIYIGLPPLTRNERLVMVDNRTRWAIEVD